MVLCIYHKSRFVYKGGKPIMMIKEFHEDTEDDLSYMDRYSRENFYKYLKNLSPKGTIIYERIEDDEENNFKYSDIEDPDLDEWDYWKNYGKNEEENSDFDDVDWKEYKGY